MLVLTRRVDESIMIGNDVKITISSIKGGQVRIGIKAPKSVEIDRLEVRERKIAIIDNLIDYERVNEKE